MRSEPEIVLRDLRPSDAAAVAAIYAERGWMGATEESQGESIAGYARDRAKHGLSLSAIEHRGILVGVAGVQLHLGRPEVGFIVSGAAEGHGIAREAVRQVIASARRLGLEELTARPSPGNHRSIALLAALGFVRRGDEFWIPLDPP